MFIRVQLLAAATVLALSVGAAPVPARADDGARKCHLEQQCKWVNFKKICVWVKVCR